LQAAPALAGIEKQVDGEASPAPISVVLDKVATGARVAQAPENPGGKVVFVGNPVAAMAAAGNGKCIEGGLEKAAENG